MARYSLYPYIIKINESNTNNYYDLRNIPTNRGNRSLFQILESFFDQYNITGYHNGDRQKTFHINEIHTRNNQLLYGIIKSGEYGYSGDFYNVEANELTPEARTANDSEELPFFFLINTILPLRNSDRAIVILQRFKNFGTKSLLRTSLKEYIENQGELNFHMKPIISNDLINKLNSVDRIIRLRLLKREVPQDVAEQHLIDNYNDVSEERVFKIKNQREFDGIRFLNNLAQSEVVRRLRNVDYPYLEIEEETYDEIKIETETGNSKTTLILSEQNNFREKYIISENQITIENGHPTLNSIIPIGVRYMNHILSQYTEAPIEINIEEENDTS